MGIASRAASRARKAAKASRQLGFNTIEGFKRGYSRKLERAKKESDRSLAVLKRETCTNGSFRFLAKRSRFKVVPKDGAYVSPDRAIYIPCGKCECCRVRASRRKAAKCFEWLRAIRGGSWGRGICLLVTYTLSPENGPRCGPAGRDRLAAGVARLKTELRRQLRFGSKIMLTVRSYEYHKDGALHGHLVVFVRGPWFLFNVVRLQDSYAEGRIDVSQRELSAENVADAFGYAMKYTLKAEVTWSPELKGTRWYSIYSRLHRLAPRSPKWVICRRRGRSLKGSFWKPWEITFHCGRSGSERLAGLSAARLLTELPVSLIRGSREVGWKLFYSRPPEFSNVLLRS